MVPILVFALALELLLLRSFTLRYIQDVGRITMENLKSSDHHSFVENHLKAVEEEVMREEIQGEREKIPWEESIDAFETLVLLKLHCRFELVRTRRSIFIAL